MCLTYVEERNEKTMSNLKAEDRLLTKKIYTL